ncbi:MAG TPA: hypothetical protein VEU62_12040 [Bryobacterales bacterium]|nr:hypothetical protein [Bryobacterales bacterium]
MSRRSWLLALLYAPLREGPPAAALVVHAQGDRLRFSAPSLRFLTGKPLERLHNGASVTFDFQLTLFAGARTARLEQSFAQFVSSYDLWEEKFSVVRLGAAARRSASHLSAAAAEAWCLDNLMLPAARLSRDKPFWVRLELREEDPKERPAEPGDPGLTLARLIEIFSRPAREQQLHLVEEAGPLRLMDLETSATAR